MQERQKALVVQVIFITLLMLEYSDINRLSTSFKIGETFGLDRV
jgi:hypothetical protein